MAIIKKYPARVIAVHNYMDGVYTLELESLSKKFKYDPGQFLHLALDAYDPAGYWPESRCFSIQSSPEEETIKISYAVKGQFTRLMQQQIRVGSELWLKLPFGNLFTQPHKKTDTVFIAGGTGITPFLSLFTHHSFRDYLNPHIYLGFRSLSYNIYKTELASIILCDPKIYYEDRDGLINIVEIHSAHKNDSNYFISGPPVMIKTFKHELITRGVPPGNVLTDEWE